MSTNAFAPALELDPNDSRLTRDILPAPGDPPKFTNPVAAAVWEAGFPKRALRMEDCGKFKTQLCEDGHTTRCHRFCSTRTCAGYECAYTAALVLVDKLRVDADHAIWNSERGHYAPRFTFVDFRFACEHNREALHDCASRLIDLLLVREGLTRTDIKLGRYPKYPFVLWAYSAGFDDSGLLVLRVLFLDANVDPDDLRDNFGATTADVHVVPMKSIRKFFPLLFAVAIPSTDAAKADMEVAFMGIRRLRTVGYIEQPEMEELLVEEGDGKTSTNNYELENGEDSTQPACLDGSPLPKKPRLCPVCHKRIVAESGWFSKFTPPPRPEETTYYPVTI